MAVPILTVDGDPDRHRVFIIVQADLNSLVTVTRISQLGVSTVRGAVDHLMTTGEAIFVDYELPQNVEVSYRATSTPGGPSAEVPAGSFDFGGDVIFDLGKPWAGLVVTVESFPQQDYDIPRDVVGVWDRPDPIVVSGERRLPSGMLNLITLSLGQKGALSDTLFTGNIVAFSPWKPTYGLPSPAYYSVGKVTETRTSPLAEEDSRRWALEVQQVSAPRSTYVYPEGTTTWQQVKTVGQWSAQLGKLWYEVAGF
jgi:hypothetical protein